MEWPNPNEVAKQTQFARMAGISQPAVHQLLSKGVLEQGQTYAEWLGAYLENLRTQAAGREQDERLVTERIRQSRADANLKDLEYFERLGKVVWVDDVAEQLDRLVNAVQLGISSATGLIIEGIESRYSITLDDELVHAPLRAALASVAGELEKPAPADSESGAGSGTATADSDRTMGGELPAVAAGER